MIYMIYFCYMLPVIIKNRIKVKKTTAKTDQTMWKSLRYTIFCTGQYQSSLWMFIIKLNTDYRLPHSRKFDISFWFPSG